MIVKENTVVYVACPALSATGGPELLHQLVHSLRINGVNAYMFYQPSMLNPVHDAYKIYANPFVETIEDDNRNVIIVPEEKSFIDLLAKYSSIRKIIWWLSVDNYYIRFNLASRIMNKLSRYTSIFENYSYEVRAKALSKTSDLLKVDQIANASFHFVQSYYAYEHLVEKGIDNSKILRLSDYVNDSFLSVDLESVKTRKKDIVIYNPKKGFHYTKKIIRSLRDINFIALQNMTRQEVLDTMVSSKVYIDFGNHPGKDRMPREAALCGNCIITGRRGSAGNSVDVSIPEKYKFEDTVENMKQVGEVIRSCLVDYERRVEDFSSYRERIRNEKAVFENDVRSIFLG